MATESSYAWKLHSIAEFREQREKWDQLNHRGPQSPVLTAMFVSTGAWGRFWAAGARGPGTGTPFRACP